MPLSWKLEAYDHAGNVIGTISRQPQELLVFEGTTDAFALCLPDLRTVTAFFTAPETLGRAAHDTFYGQGISGISKGGDWNSASPVRKALWISVAQAVLAAPTV